MLSENSLKNTNLMPFNKALVQQFIEIKCLFTYSI